MGFFAMEGPTPIGCLILFEAPYLVGEANKVKVFNYVPLLLLRPPPYIPLKVYFLKTYFGQE
jgi:hypothetical protein